MSDLSAGYHPDPWQKHRNPLGIPRFCPRLLNDIIWTFEQINWLKNSFNLKFLKERYLFKGCDLVIIHFLIWISSISYQFMIIPYAHQFSTFNHLHPAFAFWLDHLVCYPRCPIQVFSWNAVLRSVYDAGMFLPTNREMHKKLGFNQGADRRESTLERASFAIPCHGIRLRHSTPECPEFVFFIQASITPTLLSSGFHGTKAWNQDTGFQCDPVRTLH